jgi:type IV pilus assembly protein PilM
MFKRNKDIEKINLLETDLGTAVKNKIKDDSAGNLIFIAAVGLAVVVAGGWYAARAIKSKHIKDDIKSTEEYINSPTTKKQLDTQKRLLTVKSQVDSYNTLMKNTYDGFMSQPVINGEKFDSLLEIATDTAKTYGIKSGVIEYDGFSAGTININVTCDAEFDKEKRAKMAQEFPAELIKSLLAKKDSKNKTIFGSATYSGYTVTAAEEDEKSGKKSGTEENPDQVTFSVTLKMNGRQSAYVAEDAAEEANAE